MDICFWIRRCQTNKQGKSKIYCTITINQVSATPFSTLLSVNEKNWLPNQKTTDDEFYDVIRQELSDLEKKNRRIKLDLEDDHPVVTAEMVKLEFLNQRNLSIKKNKPVKSFRKQTKPSNEEIRLLPLIREIFTAKIKLGASKRTQENDAVKYNNIYKFLKKFDRVGMQCRNVDFDLIDEFVLWMRGDEKNSINYTNRHVSIIIETLDLAVRRKIIPYNSLSSYKLTFPDNFDSEGLDKEDLLKLENLHSLSSYEQKVLDIFLFMCGTGIDYCDYLKISNENIRDYKGLTILTYTRQKTDK